MLFQKRKKPRQFSYTPFYYKEDKDSKITSRKVKFKRMRTPKQSKKIPVILVILAIAVYFLIKYLKDLAQ